MKNTFIIGWLVTSCGAPVFAQNGSTNQPLARRPEVAAAIAVWMPGLLRLWQAVSNQDCRLELSTTRISSGRRDMDLPIWQRRFQRSHPRCTGLRRSRNFLHDSDPATARCRKTATRRSGGQVLTWYKIKMRIPKVRQSPSGIC